MARFFLWNSASARLCQEPDSGFGWLFCSKKNIKKPFYCHN